MPDPPHILAAKAATIALSPKRRGAQATWDLAHAHPNIVCYVMWYVAAACQPLPPPGETDPMEGYTLRVLDALRAPNDTLDARFWPSDYTAIGFAMAEASSAERTVAMRTYDAAHHGLRFRHQPHVLAAFLGECLAAATMILSSPVTGLSRGKRWYLTLPSLVVVARHETTTKGLIRLQALLAEAIANYAHVRPTDQKEIDTGRVDL